MARAIQYRRGTAEEHENFTGLDGEITVDTTNKTLRVHDGETPGGTVLAKQNEIPNDILIGDYVIETQLPTAENNYIWYRKYKSGWVEQGGKSFANTSIAGTVYIDLAITMANTNYTAVFNCTVYDGSFWGCVIDKEINIIAVRTMNYAGNITYYGGDWYVMGLAA